MVSSTRFMGDEEIADRALDLLLSEPEEDRAALVRWAADEFERCGLGHPRTDDPNDFIFDAILENPMLGDWMRARCIGRGSVLGAETFAELVDWLTPS